LQTALDLKDRFPPSSVKPASKASGSEGTRNSPPSEISDSAIRLTAELAAWRLAAYTKQAADSDDPAKIRAILDNTEAHRNWLLQGTHRSFLAQAMQLAAVLTSFLQTGDIDSRPLFSEYASYLDGTYPRLTGPGESWLQLAEHEGASGIRKRLMEFWEKPEAPSGMGTEADRAGLAVRYFQTRLQPILTAQLAALAIRAEVEAEQRSREEWTRIRTWQDRLREARGLARLCGTWQWTVHNHQNHQDHKMLMSFPPPDAPTPSGLQPAKVVVLGDGVYLRWEFQGGYQEDSLLFSSEGQRLEGTFINSAGAWGSITGKRTAPCPKGSGQNAER